MPTAFASKWLIWSLSTLDSNAEDTLPPARVPVV